ncbi:MAG TPA: carbamoyltransferase C-terminal domain-containing protein [Magnetospirillum sp.]|nr:carbamoyltransferase C-terminal domain-containing protein [Magnetospirillum sp.]
MQSVNVLGVSFGYHDAAAALIRDGVVVAAAQQERFSRRKNDPGFPADAIAHCLAVAGIGADQLSLVAYYEDSLVKFDRVVSTAIEGFPASRRNFDETVARWVRDGRFQVRERLADHLGVPLDMVVETNHHDSHGASAYFCSPFDSAAVVTLDGVGEYETATIGVGRDGRLQRLGAVRLPHSIGLFYSAFTAYLGFTVNEGEYKVMGMSAFGSPVFKDRLLDMFTLNGDGTFELDQTCFEFLTPEEFPFNQSLIDRLGPARVPGAPFAVDEAHMPEDVSVEQRAGVLGDSRRFADVAASVQACTEEVILHIVRHAAARTGQTSVCLAGGVALNSLANGRLQREGLSLFVQPAAGDAGGAVGAAAYHWHHTLGKGRMAPLKSSAFGRQFSRGDVDKALANSGFELVFASDDEGEYLAAVAKLIADGNVVGWVHGRSEWGPRALGYRSILADPTSPSIQRRINDKIKFREPFRPFAPAVIAERAAEFFELPQPLTPCSPESFMLAVHPVKSQWRERLPGVTHADGTARVQAVHADCHPVFYRLLRAFEAVRQVPILVNTSFNLNGEPIVDSPQDAIRTFTLSGLDYLCMENRILSKAIIL